MSSQIKSTFFANSSPPTLLKIWCKNLKWFSSNNYLMAPWLHICPIIIAHTIHVSAMKYTRFQIRSEVFEYKSSHFRPRQPVDFRAIKSAHTTEIQVWIFFVKISNFDRQPLMQLNMADKSKTLSLHFFFTKIPIGYNNCPRRVWRHEDASSSATARHENMREKQIIHGWFVNILPLQLHHIPNVPLLFTQRLYCGKRH